MVFGPCFVLSTRSRYPCLNEKHYSQRYNFNFIFNILNPFRFFFQRKFSYLTFNHEIAEDCDVITRVFFLEFCQECPKLKGHCLVNYCYTKSICQGVKIHVQLIWIDLMDDWKMDVRTEICCASRDVKNFISNLRFQLTHPVECSDYTDCPSTFDSVFRLLTMKKKWNIVSACFVI